MIERFTDDYLLYLLARASALVSGQFHDRLRPLGLDVAEWRILATLSGEDGMTIGEMAEFVLFRQPTLSKIIDRMEADALVERRKGDTDRRKIRVYITPSGRERVTGALAEAKTHEAEILAGYTDEEERLLKGVLRTLIGRNTPQTPHRRD